MNKWMSRINDEKSLALINIPGSHDSAAFNMFCCGSCFAKTQNYDIKTQLNIGARMLDLRVATMSNSSFDNNMIDSMICCHGVCDCYCYENNKKIKLTYANCLNQIKNFLNENPSETIIIRTDSGRGNKKINLENASKVFNSILGDISVQYNNKLILGDIRGKVVYVYSNRFEGGTDIFPIHDKYRNGNMKFNEFKVGGVLKIREINDLFQSYHYTFDEAEKYLKLPLNFETSCTGEFTGLLPLPKAEADVVNRFLREYNFKKGFYYGWIAVDFIDEIITRKIIESNIFQESNEVQDTSNIFLQV